MIRTVARLVFCPGSEARDWRLRRRSAAVRRGNAERGARRSVLEWLSLPTIGGRDHHTLFSDVDTAGHAPA